MMKIVPSLQHRDPYDTGESGRTAPMPEVPGPMTSFAGAAVRAGTGSQNKEDTGNESTAAQEKHEKIASLPDIHAATVRARGCSPDGTTGKEVRAEPSMKSRVRDISPASPKRVLFRDRIELAEGLMTRSGMVNRDLNLQGFDTTSLDDIVLAGARNLARSRNYLDSGDTREATLALSEFRGNACSLSEGYAALIATRSFPERTEQAVLSILHSLRITGRDRHSP